MSFKVDDHKTGDLTDNEWTSDRYLTVLDFSTKNKNDPFHNFKFKYHCIFRSNSLNILSYSYFMAIYVQYMC